MLTPKERGGGARPPVFPVKIDHSALFDNSSGNGLYRSFTVAESDKTKMTFVDWVQFNGGANDFEYLFHHRNADPNQSFYIRTYQGALQIYQQLNQTYPFYTTYDVIDIPQGAFGMLCVTVDTSQAVAENRVKVSWNGKPMPRKGGTLPAQNLELYCCHAGGHALGAAINAGNYLHANRAHTRLLLGAAYPYTTFGQHSDIVTGLWIPKAVDDAALSYGVNGVCFKYDNAAALGEDSSGNGNDMAAPVGVSQSVSTPTNTYATLNPLVSTDGDLTYSKGNTKISGLSVTIASGSSPSTLRMVEGKWYAEVKVTNLTNRNEMGVARMSEIGTNRYAYNADNGAVYGGSGGPFASAASGDIIGMAYDADAGTVAYYKQGVLIGTMSGVPVDSPMGFVGSVGGIGTAEVQEWNFGATGFVHTPPAGFNALCTDNRPNPKIYKSSSVVDLVARAGTGANVSISTPDMDGGPDWVNIKQRDGSAYNWQLTDTVRDIADRLHTNTAGAQDAAPDGFLSFDSNGFTLGSNLAANALNGSYLDLCLKAGLEQGFGMVKYTGDGVAGRQIPLPNGWTKAPTFMMVKNLTEDYAWNIYHVALGGTKYLHFTTSAAFTDGSAWNNTAPTGTHFTVGAGNATNKNGNEHIAYLFTDSDVFRAWSFLGNGSVDGPFVDHGGKPLWSMSKNTSRATNWWQTDSRRNPHNPIDLELMPNLNAAEVAASSPRWLYASNGIKITTDVTEFNGSNDFHVGLTILESTKYVNAF